MKWWQALFGRNSVRSVGKTTTQQRPTVSAGLPPSVSAKTPAQPPKQAKTGAATNTLNVALAAATANGQSLYAADREEAFRWHAAKGFPNPGHDEVGAVVWFTTMSRTCDNDSLWDEAWSGFHHALAGCLNLDLADRVPELCCLLGRAHTGLAHYDLAELYLETAYHLPQDKPDSEFRVLILLNKAVVAKITQNTDSLKNAYQRAEPLLFGKSSLAAGAAMTLFREGIKNAEWRRDGKPVRYCLVHSTGFFQVSLDLNHRLGNNRAIAMTQSNLGDVWSKLGEKQHARDCFDEAVRVLEKLGDSQTLGQVREWMRQL